MTDAMLIGFYAAILLVGWWGERWLTRREARRIVSARQRVRHGAALARTRIPSPINGPNLRPDVLYFKGATDGEIADKFLEDAWGHRRSEA